MRIARFILAALYLLQCVVIWVTGHHAITGTWIGEEFFGYPPVDAVVEFVFFLVFFFFSAVTCALLFWQKELVMTLVFAAAGIVPPVISALLYDLRGNLTWQVVAYSEILLGVATIFVLAISLRNRRRAVSGAYAINA